MANNTVKIALITGYLGAGKTTLLNHILSNDEGIRAAVIVNDIGEVNVDADLIEKGGVVTQENSNLVPLTNGCICCTLRDDLAAQLGELAATGKYDYIIIEASGICEPIPIAQTIADICEESTEDGMPMVLDNIIAVVDCARMHDEFEDGRSLLKDTYEEEDIENLLIQQLEFCNTVLMNKVDTVDEYQLGELKAIIRSLQTNAVIIEANYAKVAISDVLNTGRFDLEKSMESMSMSTIITTTMMTMMSMSTIITMTMMTTMSMSTIITMTMSMSIITTTMMRRKRSTIRADIITIITTIIIMQMLPIRLRSMASDHLCTSDAVRSIATRSSHLPRNGREQSSAARV